MKNASFGSVLFVVPILLVVLGVGAFAGVASADQPPINMRGPAGWFSSGEEWRFALNGYDPVAYFTEGRPMPGRDDFVSIHQGVPFRFSSDRHRALFEEDPERYVPRFGGYCAYAISQGSTASGDPLFWTIYEGRVYLNLDEATQAQWRSDRQRFIEEAEKHWPAVLGN